MNQDTPIPQVGGSSFQITPGLTPELAKTYHVTQWKPTAEAAAEGRAYADLGIFTEREMRALHHAIEHALGTPGTQDWAQGPYALPGVTPDFKPKGDWIDKLIDEMDADGGIDRFTVNRTEVRALVNVALQIDRHERDLPAEEVDGAEQAPLELTLSLVRLVGGVARFGTPQSDGITASRGGIQYGVALVRPHVAATLKVDERDWAAIDRPGRIHVTIEGA